MSSIFYRPRHAKPTKAKKQVLSLAAVGAATGAAVAPQASAAELPAGVPPEVIGFLESQLAPLQVGSSEISSEIDAQARDFVDRLLADFRGGIIQARQVIEDHLVNVSPDFADHVRRLMDVLLPLPPEPAPSPAPAAGPAPAPAAPSSAPVAGCDPVARACVDLAQGRTWLQSGGQVTYGPVPMSAGAPSPQTETPRGLHHVNRKVKDEVSFEFGNAPMPYSVYFTNNGIAFHQGNVELLSHGCVHLNHNDAAVYFDQLQIGDAVHVF